MFAKAGEEIIQIKSQRCSFILQLVKLDVMSAVAADDVVVVVVAAVFLFIHRITILGAHNIKRYLTSNFS